MSQAQLAATLTSDAVIVAFAASVLFVAVYSSMAPWWRSQIGRALVALDTGLALALAPIVMHRLAGLDVTSLAFAWYYFASLTLVAGATVWRTWIVAKTQWQARKAPGGPRPEPESAGVPERQPL
jgi:hypothetical protein